MIKKIKSIGNLAVFKGFDWDNEVREKGGPVQAFQAINIIYGRNYSGKTTLSRILRAMETGELSDKYENPSFSVALMDESQVTQTTLTNHDKKIRVFNEDFVRANLRFIADPEDCIKSFAILGDDNNKIEQEIEKLQAELGSMKDGEETGLYAQLVKAKSSLEIATQEYTKVNNALEKQLSDKATDRKIGIKYKPERFGDQNYNTPKLKADIEKVQGAEYQPPTEEQVAQFEKLISEKMLSTIPIFNAPSLTFKSITTETETLVTKKISDSDKIEELVKDAILNRWVSEGRTHHKGKRDKCAFCGNQITEDRWKKLEQHYDQETEQFEVDIDALITKIDTERSTITSALLIDKALFYSIFHKKIEESEKAIKAAVESYIKSLDSMINQVKKRKNDILNQIIFENPEDCSDQLERAWKSYNALRNESNNFSASLNEEQLKAKNALRLKEIYDFLITIQYKDQFLSINKHTGNLEKVKSEKNHLEIVVRQKEEEIASKKRELKDEEKGAKKVNGYLNNFFGHQFLSLEAIKEEITTEGSARIRFEVMRDGKKAYHLSEGECSLLAFCYFLAKLDDVDTRGSKPIIWIDDPISSLDGNHIFFVYSMLEAEIVSLGRFEQLFISTHNLDFLQYLMRFNGKCIGQDGRESGYKKGYFVVTRKDNISTIRLMPKYMKEHVTEFNYLFHEIYKCSVIEVVDDTNYTTFYSFGNNARKFLEIYLYYKYPDDTSISKKLELFFGERNVPAIITDKINNEYSHLRGVFERGSMPVEVPEMQTAARRIIERLREDKKQFSALMRSIGETPAAESQS